MNCQHCTPSQESRDVTYVESIQPRGNDIVIDSDSDPDCVIIPGCEPNTSLYGAKLRAPVHASSKHHFEKYKLDWRVIKSNNNFPERLDGDPDFLEINATHEKSLAYQSKKKKPRMNMNTSSTCSGSPRPLRCASSVIDKQNRIRKRLRTLRRRQASLTKPCAKNRGSMQKALCDAVDQYGIMVPHDAGGLSRLSQRATALIDRHLASSVEKHDDTSAIEESPLKEGSVLALVDTLFRKETAVAITDAFILHCEGSASDTRRELHQLRPALRRNSKLLQSILEAGPAGAQAFALQDKQEWATEDLKEKRTHWKKEALEECQNLGGVRACQSFSGKRCTVPWPCKT